MTTLQQRKEQLVREFNDNEQEITALEDVLEQRTSLREQLRGKVALLQELEGEENSNQLVDAEIIEGEAKEVTDDGKGSV